MHALQQQLLEQVGPCQCSRKRDAEAQIAWECTYRPDDDILLAPKHAYFQNVSISHELCRDAQAVHLNVQIDIGRVNPEVLCNAVIRVIIQDKPGADYFLWESGAIDQMDFADSEISHAMRMSIPMQCSQLKGMKEGGVHHLQLILEGAWGSVLDSASGEIVILK